MKKEIKLNTLLSAKNTYDMCRCYFKYDINYFYFYIFDVSNKLFLGLEEDDFITDGFQIRKLSDIKKIELKDDACVDINRQNKLLEGVKSPNVNINSWHDVFMSLKELDKIIIVENEDINPNESEFAIGKIISVKASKVHMKVFDAKGNWLDGYLEIPFRFITSVTFDARYCNYWEKYLISNNKEESSTTDNYNGSVYEEHPKKYIK